MSGKRIIYSKTKETSISVELIVDGKGKYNGIQ